MDNPDLLSGNASGQVTLSGPLIGATLRGRAEMTHGVAYPDEFIQKQVVDLSDPLYAQFVDTMVLRRENLDAGLFEIFVDSLRIDSLETDLGPDFWVRTPDANIQLDGVLLVSKRGDQYLVDGEVNALRGTYNLQLGAALSREFQVEEGTVRYFGTEDLNADINIVALHHLQTARGEEVTVQVDITGTILEPRIALSSSIRPPLSETEIISYMLFGTPSVQAFVGDRSGERRSLFEASAERFVSALSGQVEDALISRLGVPLDLLRIEPGEAQSGLSGTELLIGKQVSLFGHPSFLTASPRLCPRERLVSLERIGISLETRLSPQWGIAGSVDPVRGCEGAVASTSAPYQIGVDVFWEKREE
jgi:translocation and assembly module TamB